MKKIKKRNILSFGLLLLLIAVFLFPYYVMVVGAFKSQMALQLIPPDLNPFINLTGKNADYVWRKTEIFLWLTNSAIVSLGTAVITVLIGATAGYSFAKKKVSWKRVGFYASNSNHAFTKANASDTQLSCRYEATSDKFQNRTDTYYRIPCFWCIFVQAVYGEHSYGTIGSCGN